LEVGEAMRRPERWATVPPEAAAAVARRYVTPERAFVIRNPSHVRY